MLTFQNFKGGLYLLATDVAHPGQARVGFLFRDASRTDPTFQLSAQSWADPNAQGYFAFFVPSSTRDWDSFAQAVRTSFSGTYNAQFGWFSESGGTVTAAQLIAINHDNPSEPLLQATFPLTFRNVALQVNAFPFLPSANPVISFDDATNAFLFSIPTTGPSPAVTLVANPPLSSQQTFKATSQNLVLPLTGSGAATVNVGFQLTGDDLSSAFQAGLSYYAPPPRAGAPLAAFHLPLFRAPGGASTPLGLNVWMDLLSPLENTRTYFQLTDARVGSYFASTAGQPFALLTVDGGGGAATTSRLVFANQPVNSTQDTDFFSLAPAGQFQVAMDTRDTALTAPLSSAGMLCGVTGTEFLSVSVGNAADTLEFVPGSPAYQLPQPVVGPSSAQYLDSVNGNVTTSWARLLTSSGSYVSQPEQAPLYQQDAQRDAKLASGPSVYLLDFLPLPAWSPSGAQQASPAFPLVPYAGLPATTALEPFRELESNALNPTRRQQFTTASAQARAARSRTRARATTPSLAMTPQGLLAELDGSDWSALQIATSGSGLLQLTRMGTTIQQTLQQNQVFAVISTTQNGSLFNFTGSNQQLDIADWIFSLSPDGTKSSDGTPPILMLKFYPGQSISDLVEDVSLWSSPNAFNVAPFEATDAQTYLQDLIQAAHDQVYGEGGDTPDTSSNYYNFYQTVTDPEFTGVLAVNCNLQLNTLPDAIRAVLGGMTRTVDDQRVSNIDAFRAHHVGIQINDTDPDSAQPTLSQSSLFGLVDYEKPADETSPPDAVQGVGVAYNFEVEYLRALFINSELRNFESLVNLTINNLFNTGVTQQEEPGTAGEATSNVIAITGTYQAHSTSGDSSSSGQGLYSFIAEGDFAFDFDENPYLKNITLTKLQFTFQNEAEDDSKAALATDGATSTINARFSIWGSMEFNELNVLDLFSFEKLVFADLGIGMSYDLTTYPSPKPPTMSTPQLSFSPGDLRFDLGQTTKRDGDTSLLRLLPFKLRSFIYSEKADQTLESLKYFKLSAVPGLSGVKDTFNYGLLFDLDLGSMGGLVGSLSAFKFSFIIGWLSGEDGGIAFGIQLPEASGKLELTIEGVLSIIIEQFQLQYVTVNGDTGEDTQALVLAIHNSYMEILGTRLPPGSALFDFLLFVPTQNPDKLGWIAAINNEGGGGGGREDLVKARGESSVFELLYLGGGQRVGPSPDAPPTTFQELLDYMTGDFWTAVQDNDFASVYHPDSQWLAITHFKLLGIVDVGLAFYDLPPFYSLTLNVEKLFNFEITYTKVSDSVGLFYANFQLPDSLRTFQVGAASLTLPAIGVSVYTNGDWKLDVGFPANDDWSRSFQVQAMAGPVPVTGAGGFYLASLSSATSDIFKGTYPSILAFGFGARLGVGKDFTAGPLKAGVSLTFFGIIEGAAGYLSSGSTNIFQQPDALSLKGQFGVIGELYGSVDFVILKASVNVRLQASIGVQLSMERSIPGSGTILLYIQASVRVSASVSIDLGFFSITISFSFKASFRFQWQLGGSESPELARLRSRRLALTVASGALPLGPGLNPAVPIWFLPEVTVVFPDATQVGTPWFAGSLGIPFDPNPPATVTFAQLKPFETMTAQLVTWVLGQVLGQPGSTFKVTQEQLARLDQEPTVLVGWVDYPTLLSALKVFTVSILTPASDKPTQASATVFPMFPFLQIATQGRLDSQKRPDDLQYVFASKNPVSEQYIQDTLQTYFNQLFVNQGAPAGSNGLASMDTTTPLAQEIFLDYFQGLLRGAVHSLLQTMEDADLPRSPVDQLILKAVSAQQFANLAGQMSSYFRGGLRLPYAPGMTTPGGAPQTGTNPLYALLWQEFPVGTLSPIPSAQAPQPTASYSLTLSNPDTTQSWVTSTASYTLTDLIVTPYQGLSASAVDPPGAPTQLPFIQQGPQAFAFQNPIPWTQSGGAQASLVPFPANLVTPQTQQGAQPIQVLVQSRETGAAYLPGGTALPTQDFQWVTQLTLAVKQVPAATGSTMLKNIYALAGASQRDQALLQQLIALVEQGSSPIAGIQILYQSAAGAAGLNSAPLNAQDVFLLRTNTTTVSAPPTNALFMTRALAPSPDGVPVGARLDETESFLRILQQASVTNAPGYYLHYQDASGNDLPPALFASGPAPLTVLVTYVSDGTGNTPQSPARVQPYYNAVALTNTQPSLLYYANTTDPALDTQYPAVAAGSVGVELDRDNDPARLRLPASVLALEATGLRNADQRFTHFELSRELHDVGFTDDAERRALLAEAGAAPAQLTALYSLLTYQVPSSPGFITSNLSAPIQPQQPEDGTPDGADDYRVFVPLYKLATANQGLAPGASPDRYASLAEAFSVDFFVTDAFGNQFPLQNRFQGTNSYFDAITPVDQWSGIVASYDFSVPGGQPTANTLTVYLTPSAAAFSGMSADQAASTVTLYQGILDQLTAQGVSFYIESNLTLDASGAMARAALTPAQSTQVINLVRQVLTYLQQLTARRFAAMTVPPFNVQPVALTVALSGPGTLPPAFELATLLGISRDASLISPLLKDAYGNITYPPAQNVTSTVASTVGSSGVAGNPVSLATFATAFAQAFPGLAMSVTTNGATSAQGNSSTGRARARLRAQGLAADGTGSTGSNVQSLWAVQRSLLDITIGTQAGPYYLSPKPLDNSLNTAVVPLPVLAPSLPQLPVQQLFTDVDLDQLNRGFFQAVDRMLAPAPASAAFQNARTAYTLIAQGREQLAEEFSANEVGWLFSPQSPFTGSVNQLTEAQESFEQQMRAALASAYAIDTVIQYPVAWSSPVPAAVKDQFSLFGQVQPTQPGGTTGLSTAQVPVEPTGPGLLTFLYGTPDIEDETERTLDLEFNVTHVQYFLEPANQTPEGEARPSLWLQLVNPYTSAPPHIGPAGTPTTIPLVYREYPTPPTLVSQTGVQESGAAMNPGSLAQASQWRYTYQYQARLTAHDQLLSTLTYNTDLSASGSGGVQATNRLAAGGPYSLFESLARFSAAYAVLQPILNDSTDSRWPAAVTAFSSLVTEVVNNTDWNPTAALLTRTGLANITDTYGITDAPSGDNRRITLAWSPTQGPSSFPGVTLAIEAIAPNGQPYPGQVPKSIDNGITDTYAANPPLQSDWVWHQVAVDSLNVMSAENALAGVQVQRNVLDLPDPQGQSWQVLDTYIYKTPLVRFSQPVTPFIDDATPIDVAKLPGAGEGPGCESSSPDCLCQRIYTLMSDLVGNSRQLPVLLAARSQAGLAGDAPRRVKVQCGFQYALPAAVGGQVGTDPMTPRVPVLLARSFVVDGSQPVQLGDFARLYSDAVTAWSQTHGVAFGPGAEPAGARLVFDITLYAELSSANTPVLRLRNLQLALTDIAPSQASAPQASYPLKHGNG